MSDAPQDNVSRINNARIFRPEAVQAYAHRRVGEPWAAFARHSAAIMLALTWLALLGAWLIFRGGQ